jgi:very-short-patch-repair endonuclease
MLKIENEAHTLLNEQGIDVLYLALGMLEWYEDPNATTPRYAPLVLVPVELVRESARNRFKVSYTGADLGPNLTLAAKLKGEFHITLPGYADEFDLAAYLEAVEAAVQAQPRWKVLSDRIGLGLFQFGKFQMYADLDPANWPEAGTGPESALIQQLLEQGFQRDADLLQHIADHEHIATPEVLHLIKDADSSQLEAILAVMEGSSLVIQGPPGTGKSQTITNLIGEAIARGKKVLFVAQKMAALEVVKARLDECHLGDAVLELHSHKSNKAAVLESLRSVFNQGKPQSPDRSLEYRRLSAAREQLDEYVKAVSQPILKSGLNFVECLGRMLDLQHDPRLENLARIRFDLLREWGREELGTATRALTATQNYLAEFGQPDQNPFNASGRRSLSPSQEQDLRKYVKKARESLDTLVDDADELAAQMHLPEVDTFADLQVLYRAGKRALDAPHLSGVRLTTQDWQVRRDEINELIDCGVAMAEIRERHSQRFIDAIFEADLLPIRMGLAGRADKWWRFFSGEYRRSKQALSGYAQGKLDGSPVDWLGCVDELLVYQKQRKRFSELEPTGAALFGAQWQGDRSDWTVLKTLKEWIVDLYEAIGNGELPKGLTDFLQAEPDLKAWEAQINALEPRYQQVDGLLKALIKFLKWAPGLSDDDGLDDWNERLEQWENSAALYNAVRFNQLQDELKEAGLGSLVGDLRQWPHAPNVLVHWLEYSYYSGLVDAAYAQLPRIGQFDRLTHERLIQEFAQLDQATFSYAQETLVAKLHEALPSLNAPGEMDVLRREFSKKRRHIAIRRLIAEASHVIQQAKPVFMMSPMSVATYLPQGTVKFDLVIFDEASQIPAPEALGALMRGAQVVVVGDSKQMPPTNFFSRSVEVDDEEADESVTADVESILGLMLSRGAPERMLRWHYRSRHHSLIAVSNDQFYNNQLLVFPGSGANPYATGLNLKLLQNTHYDRGGSRANLGEAQAVARAVLEHIQQKPHQSLGVVAFSVAQRDVIVLEVERLRREYPETEEFFQHHAGGDEFFIKNLENVQGDERDTIFISIGYGRTAAGNLGFNFGPLNTKGGERRLNVLISRARLSMEVFCNFTADELKVDANSPFGLRALKVFLQYAETGVLPVSQETDREPDSPFELEVKQAIERLGYEVQPQVGCQGFYIDLAVRDPNKPGRYILAVECDGASYHSSVAARDRDRLRQSVLEGLGWRFHRIWSTEWFRNAAAETERLKDAIEGSIRYQEQLDREVHVAGPKPEQPSATPEIVRTEAKDEFVTIPAYKPVSTERLGLPVVNDFLGIPDSILCTAIRTVAAAEGPVHLSLLTSRLLGATGQSRAGPRIQSKMVACIATLQASGAIRVREDFVSLPGQTIRLRDWSEFEMVSDDELRHALLVTVRDGYSLERADCMSAALSLIGFKRLTTAIKARLDNLIDGLIGKKRFVESSGRLQLSDEARSDLQSNIVSG